MTFIHYLGAAAVLLLVTAVGLYSGSKVKTAHDFAAGGRRAGLGIVLGGIVGTLVGGASTIGTAQLAFRFGISAWWFTLGGGIGCLLLALVFMKPLYNSGITTLPEVFRREYGSAAGTLATVLTSVGSFLSVVSQVLSGVALIAAVSALPTVLATGLVAALMLAYVIFGGVWGAGYVGLVKTVLLGASIIGCGVLALFLGGGLAGFAAALPRERYFNIFARGVSVDLGAGLSLVLGVLTSQAYIQAIISAKTLRVSRTGTLLSAVLIPLMGLGGVFVGMYMRLASPDIAPAAALPLFVLQKVPPFLAGVILATLLVGVIGTGAGVSLGLSAMFCNDIYKSLLHPDADDRRLLLTGRLVIVTVLALAALLSAGNTGSMILSWSFLSMGLRGAVGFGPLCTALFLPGRVKSRYVLCSMLVGPLLVVAGKALLPAEIDSLFLGVAGQMLILGLGALRGGQKTDGFSGGKI